MKKDSATGKAFLDWTNFGKSTKFCWPLKNYNLFTPDKLSSWAIVGTFAAPWLFLLKLKSVLSSLYKYLLLLWSLLLVNSLTFSCFKIDYLCENDFASQFLVTFVCFFQNSGGLPGWNTSILHWKCGKLVENEKN